MISKHAQAYVRQRDKKLEEELELKAGKDDIISTINLSSEGVAIQGNKIDLTGAVSVNDNVTIDEDGKITAVDGTFSGTIQGSEIIGSSFTVEGDSGSDTKVIVRYGTKEMQINPWYFCAVDSEALISTSMLPGVISVCKNEARNPVGVMEVTGGAGRLILYDSGINAKITATGSTGNITCVSLTQTSDRNAKEDIKEIPEENAVRFIKSLRPVEFKFKGMDGKHHGFIAQEVVADWDLVSEGEMKSLAYNEIIADLVATVQNLTKRVEKLEEKLNG